MYRWGVGLSSLSGVLCDGFPIERIIRRVLREIRRAYNDGDPFFSRMRSYVRTSHIHFFVGRVLT